jgi:hypothetical protein
LSEPKSEASDAPSVADAAEVVSEEAYAGGDVPDEQDDGGDQGEDGHYRVDDEAVPGIVRVCVASRG